MAKSTSSMRNAPNYRGPLWSSVALKIPFIMSISADMGLFFRPLLLRRLFCWSPRMATAVATGLLISYLVHR